MVQWDKARFTVTGGHGFLGRWLIKALISAGVSPNQIFVPRSREFDLRDDRACREVCSRCDVLVHLAARVGGIGYHMAREGEMFFDNALMGLQLLREAAANAVGTVLVVGTACSYPDGAPLPLNEVDLWGGVPSGPTSYYGMAKRILAFGGAAIRKQYGTRFIYVIPTNLYGPEDYFDEKYAHVIPSLIQRFERCRREGSSPLTVWGNPHTTRDFLFVEDAARLIVKALERVDDFAIINGGSGRETSVLEIAELIREAVFQEGEQADIVFDAAAPVGVERRLLDTTRASELGWVPAVDLRTGIQRTVQWYRDWLDHGVE